MKSGTYEYLRLEWSFEGVIIREHHCQLYWRSYFTEEIYSIMCFSILYVFMIVLLSHFQITNAFSKKKFKKRKKKKICPSHLDLYSVGRNWDFTFRLRFFRLSSWQARSNTLDLVYFHSTLNDSVAQCHKWSEPASPPVASTADMLFHKGCTPGRCVLGSLRNKLRLHVFFHGQVFFSSPFMPSSWKASAVGTLNLQSILHALVFYFISQLVLLLEVFGISRLLTITPLNHRQLSGRWLWLALPNMFAPSGSHYNSR